MLLGLRLDWKLICLQVFAIAASYLILFIPVSSATTVSIFQYQGSGSDTAVVEYEQKIGITVLPSAASGTVRIAVVNTTDTKINQVKIYKCGNSNPSDCASNVIPDLYSSGVDHTYQWSELANSTAGKHQTGHVLILAEMLSGSAEWVGSFQKVFRNTPTSNFITDSDDLSTIAVYAYDSAMPAVVNFINEENMIPFNSNWVVSVVLSGVNAIHKIFADDFSDVLEEAEVHENTITSMPADYMFAFGESSSGSYFNPIALNLNPTYTCGNGVCEASKAENSGNCCFDCPCGDGFFCDSGLRECRADSQVTLELVGQETGISDCRYSHEITVYVRISEPFPTGMVVTGQTYQISGNPVGNAACTESGGLYTCTLIVPADPGCTGQESVIGPNKIMFGISYDDGDGTASRVLERPFDDIRIGSWTCGAYGCESGLGEDFTNCCYDCPCEGDGKYCSYKPGDYDDMSCKADLVDNDLQISKVNPRNFYMHSGNDYVSFIAKIVNKPRGLSSVSPSCDVDCARDDGGDCDVACTMTSQSCVEKVSASEGIYNSSCSMRFTISDQICAFAGRYAAR